MLIWTYIAQLAWYVDFEIGYTIEETFCFYIGYTITGDVDLDIEHTINGIRWFRNRIHNKINVFFFLHWIQNNLECWFQHRAHSYEDTLISKQNVQLAGYEGFEIR